jgi:hypothetical protein
MQLPRHFWSKISPILFFTGLLLLGLLIYKDYGISFDEFFEWSTGLVTLKYLVEVFAPHLLTEVEWLKDVEALETYSDADHGITVALPLVVLKSLLGIKTWEGMFFFRHLANFLLFYIGVFFFYLLGRAHFKSRGWALLGCLMLVLSPRIFADAFYNSKDLPFLSFCIIAAYTMVRYLEKPTYGRAAWHAFACALAIDTRIMGILLPALTGGMLLLLVLRDKKPAAFYRTVLLYFILLAVFIIALWPYLWADPVNRFAAIFENMRHFRWGGTTLYFGEFIPASQLPWHYISVWMLITTPVGYTLFFLAGLATLLFRLKKPREADLLLYIYPAFLLAALAAVAVLNTVLYDGWRHMFFVYFAFLMISLVGMRAVWHHARLLPRYRQLLVILVLGGNLLGTAWFMVGSHPHQNVYFSLLSGKTAEKNFERDYWGLSYRQGLEFLLQHDTSAVIRYWSPAPGTPAHDNSYLFPEKDRKRLHYVPEKDSSQAAYFLTGYRWHPQPYPYANEVYTIRVDGMKILSVFKLK